MSETVVRLREETPLREHCGEVTISRKFIEEHPEAVMQMFWQAIPVRAELHYYGDKIVYTLMSRSLQHCEGGFPIPYRAMFNGNRFVGFEPL